MSRRTKGKKPATPQPPPMPAIESKPDAPPAVSTPENAAHLADSFVGNAWFDGHLAVRNLGRSLVIEATSRMSYDPDHAIAMANAYVALLAADKRARA